MIFIETRLAGAFVVELERHEDERGFFARSWSEAEFAGRGLESQIVECNVSFNRKKGTLRGMHYQREPHGQVKLVRCTRGAIFDVIIDLRPDSVTFKRWVSAELTENNHRALYVPRGFAHGFQTLTNDAEVFYQMAGPAVSSAAAGVRWNDPAFGIEWPDDNRTMIARDHDYPDFTS